MNRRLVAITLALGLSTAFAAPSARAQWAVDFAFGSGGYHHHHHHHGWHGSYGYYSWPRPYYEYVYVAPPPVVYVPTAPAVVPLMQTQPSVPATSATVRSNNAPTYRGPGVTIRNPSASGTSLALVVDSRREVELASGEAKLLTDKSTYHLEFDRGGDFGTARKNVSEGLYEFVATDRGWDLQRVDETSADGSTPVVRRNALPTTR